MERTISEYGPALKVVHFDQSCYLGWLDRNALSIWQNFCSQYRSFVFLLSRTITKRAVAWVGSVQPECTVPSGMWNFRNFKTGFFVEWEAPCLSLVVLKGKRQKDNVKIMERRWSLSNSVSSIPPDFVTASWQRGLNSPLVELMQASVEVREFSKLVA